MLIAIYINYVILKSNWFFNSPDSYFVGRSPTMHSHRKRSLAVCCRRGQKETLLGASPSPNQHKKTIENKPVDSRKQPGKRQTGLSRHLGPLRGQIRSCWTRSSGLKWSLTSVSQVSRDKNRDSLAASQSPVCCLSRQLVWASIWVCKWCPSVLSRVWEASVIIFCICLCV